MKKFYITNGVTQDGFGARLQRCFQVMCYVYELQAQGIPVEYIHTPLSYNENTPINEDRSTGETIRSNFSLANHYPYNDISEEGYNIRAKLWDNFLNYKGKTVEDIDITSVNIQQANYDTIAKHISTGTVCESKILFVLRYLHSEYDAGLIDINIFDKYRNTILKKFNLAQKRKPKKPQIAIHIRRKDILDKPGRYLPDDYYVGILQQLEKFTDKYGITIYSQEVGFNKDSYSSWNTVLDTDQEDFTTFKKLVQADYLITGKSSFSYTAALLNKNTVIHHFTGHISLNSWITANNYINLLNII
jgi:hypothetical protein